MSKSDLAISLMRTADAQKTSMVKYLKRLVEAESPSSVPDTHALVFSILYESLDALGYEVNIIPGKESGGQLLARHPRHSGRAQQLLLGHSDTVWPMGTIKSMPLVYQGNVVKGPGVYDMTGGLTQLIFALKILERLGIETPTAPVVYVNSDEETGSRESRSTIEHLAKRVGRVFVLEPSLGTEGRLKIARKGVGRYHLQVTGRAAHAGLDPEKGISAILEMSYQIQNLHALNDIEKGVTINVGKIEGGLQPNVIAPSCRVEIDVRITNQVDAKRIEEQIFSLSPVTSGTHIDVDGGINRPPLEPTSANLGLWKLAQKIGRDLGLELESGSAGGGSDGNFTSQFTPTLDGLGSVGDGAHAQHEFVYVDKMIERTALLAYLLASPLT